MRRAILAPLLTVAALTALTACGGSSTKDAGSSASTASATATTAPLVSGSETTPPAGAATTAVPRATSLADAKRVVAQGNSLNDTQAACVVQKLTDAVGETRAIAIVNDASALDVLPGDENKIATAALVACVDKKDFGKVIANSFYEALKDVGVTQAHATCFGDKLVESLTPEALVGLGSTGASLDELDPATQAKVVAALGACLPADLFGQLSGALTPSTTAAGATTSKP